MHGYRERVPSDPADVRMTEWSECRTTIGRLDSILADIRKYGFTLVTVLLTASALVTTANPVADRVAASSVVMALLLVLYLMDRYWWGLLRQAASRASELETHLTVEDGRTIQISQQLGAVAQRIGNTAAASAVYGVFILVACGVALVTVAPSHSTLGLSFLSGVTALALAAIFVLHRWFEARVPREPGGGGSPQSAHAR